MEFHPIPWLRRHICLRGRHPPIPNVIDGTDPDGRQWRIRFDISVFSGLFSDGRDGSPISFFVSGTPCLLHLEANHPDHDSLRQLLLDLRVDDAVELTYRMPESRVQSMARTSRVPWSRNIRFTSVEE